MADLTSLHVDRASLGVTDTLVPTSPLRLGTLAAAGAGTPKLAIDANGNVTAGVLVVGDMPLGADWIWSAGKTITFATGPLAAPAPTSRSVGTRLVLEAVAGSTEHAQGRETGALWTSVPLGAAHKWYQGATERLRLETDGTLKVVNGSGGLRLEPAAGNTPAITSTGPLTVDVALGALSLATQGGQILPATGYRENLGALSRRYLSLHAAELWVETLVAQNTLATIGGRILVGPTTALTRDLAPGDTTIYVKHNSLSLHVPGVEFGSKLVLEAAGKFEVMAVDQQTPPTVTASGDYGYLVVRNWDGSGSDAWYAGDAVFDTGKVTAPAGAFLDLYSVRGVSPGSTAGPTIVGNVRTGQNATDWRERWAIGQLQGLYNGQPAKFGAAFGDPTTAHVMIDATDGVRIIRAGVGNVGHWDTAGNLSLGYTTAGQMTFTAADGTLRIKYAGADKFLLSGGDLYLNSGLVCGAFGGTFPYIRSQNATAWNSGRGFYFGYDTATTLAYALIGSLASPARYIQWNGSTLKLVSDGVTIDEFGITVLQASGPTAEPGRLVRFGTAGGYLWDTTAAPAGLYMARQTGDITVTAFGGNVFVSSAVGAQASYFALNPTYVEYGGQTTGGRPPLRPSADGVFDFGASNRRWQNMYAWRLALFLSGTAAWLLELGVDQAVKPTSSTWTVASDGRAKDDVVGVDPDAALALVRRVPVIRFRYTGAFGTPAGERGIGVIAQDLEPIIPASISRRPDTGALHWNAHELFMLNVAAVQALAARVDALERQKDRPYDS